MKSENSWMHTLYCLNLNKQQEREYKSPEKKFINHLMSQNSQNKFTLQTDKEFLTMLNFEHTK